MGIITNSVELNEEVFVLGLYHGLKKPDDKNKYLSSLVLDLNNLMSSGFYYNGNHILVRHASFVCDAPAFALIAGVKITVVVVVAENVVLLWNGRLGNTMGHGEWFILKQMLSQERIHHSENDGIPNTTMEKLS